MLPLVFKCRCLIVWSVMTTTMTKKNRICLEIVRILVSVFKPLLSDLETGETESCLAVVATLSLKSR